MRIHSLFLALVLLAAAGTAHAQDRTLDRVQNMIATGRLTEARNTLAQWERENGEMRGSATTDDRARALFLSGVLSTDAKVAEDAFLGVVLSYPSSPVAPEALLRLGQALHTAGETRRAIAYLERLRYDYPGAPPRETGMLWLSRAQLAMGEAAAACGTAREGLLATTNENVRTLIELERDRACARSGGIAQDAPAPASSTIPNLDIAVDTLAQQSSRAEPAPPRTDDARTNTRSPAERTGTTPPQHVAATPPPPHTTGPEYAVQTAAFSQRRSAEVIAAELRARGFDARIVTVPGSPYFRVRCGAYATGRDAAAAALSIRDAGFATLIVNDVRLEQRF